MTRNKKNQKRPLTSPENTGSLPEKRSVNDNNTAHSTDWYTMASPGYVQPLNMANSNSLNNYQTPPGTFFTPVQAPMPFHTQYVGQVSGSPQPEIPNFQQAVLNRLDAMDKRLGKLDTIEEQINTVTKKLSAIESRVSALESSSVDMNKRFAEIETSRVVDAQTCDEILSKQDSIDKQLCDERKKFNKLASDFESLSKAKDAIQEDLVDIQSRSMRDNLLFFGFPEASSVDERRTENCTQKILDFCVDTLKIENARTDIKIERAHRVGRFLQQKNRPIVVRFNHFPDKTLIKSKAFAELKNSGYRVSEQFPKAIQDKRKQLIPVMIQAKQDGKTAFLSYDKLIINGTSFTVENVHRAGYS